MVSPTKNARILIVLLLVTAVFRLWTVMMIHTGIDERDYWYSAKSISQGLEYPYLNHRTIRWSVVLPVAAGQLVTGVHPNAYYVLPILNALAQTALLFLLGKRLFDRKTATLACLFMIFFPYQIRAASQIRPEIFSITYMLAMLWFFAGYWKTPDGQTGRRALMLSSALLYVAYHSKITNLFFLPGMLVLIALRTKDDRRKTLADSAIFGGICLVAFLVETVLYGALAGFPLGHLQIIAANHLGGMQPLSSWTEIFNRYLTPYLQPYWQIPFIAFAAIAVDSLAKKRHRSLPLVVIPALSFFFFITVAVSGLHPLRMAEPFTNRYFSAVLPFVFLGIGWYAARFAEHLLAARGKFVALLGRAFCPLALAGTALFMIVFSLPSLPGPLGEYFAAPFSKRHPFSLNERYRSEINAAWDRGLSVVAAADPAGINAVGTVAWYYLDIDRYGGTRAPIPVTLTDERFGGEFTSLGGRNPAGTDRVIAVVRKPFRAAVVPVEDVPLIAGEAFPASAREIR